MDSVLDFGSNGASSNLAGGKKIEGSPRDKHRAGSVYHSPNPSGGIKDLL